MYSIGEFSKINRITTKTLRHYDKIGLLKPGMIDGWTGYRYYSPHQLVDIKRILLFKDMGFSLKDIELIICKNGCEVDLIKRQISELKSKVISCQNILKRTEVYLQNYDEGVKMKREIIIKELPEVIIASMRTIVAGYNTYFDIVPKMEEYLKSIGAKSLDEPYSFIIYHDREFKESDIDVEICEAVVKECQENDVVKFKKINHVNRAVTILHKGPYSTLKESYNEIYSWISKKGYEVADNPRESFIDGIWNKDDPNDWLTEIQVPII